MLNGFGFYPSDRLQCVNFRGKISSAMSVNYGVQWGTVLGPAAFKSVINVMNNCEFKLFTLGTVICISGISASETDIKK